MAVVPFEAFADQLADALDAFDWEGAEAVCSDVIRKITPGQSGGIAPATARRMLRDLRRKRRFALLERLAEACLFAGIRSAQIRRQYAQALIDQGRFAAAEAVLGGLLNDPETAAEERAEATGLIGRLYKQLYVNTADPATPGQPVFLHQAIAAYWEAYAQGPQQHYWHGINVVALLARAERDAVLVPQRYPDRREIASAILEMLAARAERGSDAPPAFDVATRLEALVALERWEEAERVSAAYVRCRDADEFELASTERQFREVWALPSGQDGGGRVLSILRAVLLKKQGGAVTLASAAVSDERPVLDSAPDAQALEAVLGGERFQTLRWYTSGLDCCASVARIETRSGRGFGTGWLVQGDELSSEWGSEPVLITNKHVISPALDGRPYMPAPSRQALLPHDAIVYLQIHGVRLEVADLLWTSPDLELDATIVRLKGLPPAARPLSLYPTPLVMHQPPARVYIIGHPDGRDLEFSLHDNVMLACDARRLHYRAPTEGGSSGSPVFDGDGWRVVALHHAGGRGLARLGGAGTYDANEGIAITAIRQAIARLP